MSITPDETRQVLDTRCSGCGNELHVNQRAIWFDAMAYTPLLLGDCCADRVIGALIQDLADALTKHSSTWPSHWITQAYAGRMNSVADKAEVISKAYREAITGLRFFENRPDNSQKTKAPK